MAERVTKCIFLVTTSSVDRSYAVTYWAPLLARDTSSTIVPEEMKTRATIGKAPAGVDEQLIRLAQQGDPAALRTLVDTCHGRIFAIAFRLLGRRELAEEVTQETFLKAFRSLKRYRARAPFVVWLAVIARNLCRDLARRPRLEIYADAPVPAAPPGDNPEIKFLGRERIDGFQRALMKLPFSLREAFVLRQVEGLEYSEIAKMLRITTSNAKVRVHRARTALLQALAEVDNDV